MLKAKGFQIPQFTARHIIIIHACTAVKVLCTGKSDTAINSSPEERQLCHLGDIPPCRQER